MSYKVKIIGNIEKQEKTWDLVHFLSQQHGMSEEEADIFAVAVGEAYGNGLLYSPENYSELLIDFKEDQILAEIENDGKEINFKGISGKLMPVCTRNDSTSFCRGGKSSTASNTTFFLRSPSSRSSISGSY